MVRIYLGGRWDLMSFRIYVDEAGTHSEEWLIIGMLFVPDHGVLHAALSKARKLRSKPATRMFPFP